MSKEIAEEYASSLADLTVNSKPLINMLTILAEENIDHAGVIVETVEKHLEKVPPEIKLPVLYLVDSIIKNVGGAYTQKFSQSIVNMFTKTFKQVDEKIRSQMFKLRETWHDVFPGTKLYQLDVKVNLIDPAWPIQAQPHQSTIHVNPNFLKKNLPTTSTTPVLPGEEEKMKSILAKKEQELLMLQRKKIEMELEQTRRQLEIAEKNVKMVAPVVPASSATMPVALVNPVAPVAAPEIVGLPAKSRLGPPVNKPTNRIAPVSGVLAGARRDPRLARRPAQPAPTLPVQAVLTSVPPYQQLNQVPIASNVFDIKPLDRVTKRKNVITIDVNPETIDQRPNHDPRRRDPRFDKRQRTRVRDREDRKKEDDKRKLEIKDDKFDRKNEDKKIEEKDKKEDKSIDKIAADKYIDKIIGPEKKIKLPPIPKISRDEVKDKDTPSPVKRKKELIRTDKKKKRDSDSSKDSSCNSSPEKKNKKDKRKTRQQKMEVDGKPEPEIVSFKELKNYHKERYMRRNKEKSASPEVTPIVQEEKPESESSNVQEVTESKDVDLRVLPVVEKAGQVAQKRPSTEALVENKVKKNKLDKFDILFGNEDVDLRQLPQVEESVVSAPISPKKEEEMSPLGSPKKDWHEIKEKEERKTPTKLDLVRAKLAEATKGKDRLGRPLMFSKANSEERDRRRTLSSEDTDLRNENPEDFDAEDHKKTISIIMSQAKEQYSDGQLDKGQYNALMYQVLQLNEKLKLKEAKQRESLEISKRKLNKFNDNPQKVVSPKSTPNTFGDIDERITPAVFMDTPPDSKSFIHDSDMRMNVDSLDGPPHRMSQRLPMFMGPYWRGQPRPRIEEYVPRGPAPMFRGPNPQFFRGQYEPRIPRPPFEPRLPMPLPMPQMGIRQGECPLEPYERCSSPPSIGTPGVTIPPTDISILEYIDLDPVKTIQIDGIPREIRFYGETAVIMLDWDDPREIKFLPGCRRITFDNKDSVVLSFNDPYKQVEIDDQVFDIRFGAPTRELYINGRWFECFFGGQPLGVIIDGKPRLVHLEGPLPQVDIGKAKRTDLVAGKINLIVNATQMCPVYLDAKVQKFTINGLFFTIRFVDSLRTVLINEQPFKVDFGDLPKPIFVGSEKFFIRFSALPRNVKPGYVQIANMEGVMVPIVQNPSLAPLKMPNVMEVDPAMRPPKTPSPEGQGLDMLASVMPLPTNMETPASASEYSLAEPLFLMPKKIPGLETASDEKPTAQLSILGNINVTDLFAKLVATGIVQMPNDKDEKEEKKPKEDIKSVIKKVDLLKSETLRVKQPGVVTKLYGGMQCSGCGTRFPPEHTVRYSQHLDWHFRQNRRERDSARRPHSRHWHYDLADWLNYEELEDVEEREKSWFESGGLETPSEREEEIPSTPADSASARCGLCGDNFDQFYNEDKEEWHLRNAVIFEDKNYHPVCLEDYKASLAKESEKTKLLESKQEGAEEKTEDSTEEKEQKQTEPIDIDEEEAKSDSESEVEVIEDKNEPVEIDEELDEDDVVFKAEPVEQLTVEDEDTDDETSAVRKARDEEVDFTKVKVKQEPIDPDDEPLITAEEEANPTTIDMTIPVTTPSVTYSIDGNVQLEAPTPATTFPLGGIRINITKSIPAVQNNNVAMDDGFEDVSADDEPLPPGEEPELEYKLKPGIEDKELSRQPPIQKGNELSGLCSIM